MSTRFRSQQLCSRLLGLAVLSLLLFVRPSHPDVLARSARGPASQVVGAELLDPQTAEEETIDAQLRALIAEQALRGDPTLGRNLPDISEPLPQLGKKLFFTKALSGDKDVACASCHWPTLGGGDALALSIGVGADEPDRLGPGRTHPSGGPTVPRNAPTTFNIGLYDQVLFHDGRVESLGKTVGMGGSDALGIRTPDSRFGRADAHAGDNLTAAQSRFPVTSIEEMRGAQFEAGRSNDVLRYHLAARIGNYAVGFGELDPNQWLDEFQGASGRDSSARSLVMERYIAEAIGEYERSQVFVETPWKAYVGGELDALDLPTKRGALLFFKTVAQGGAGCANCHTGDFFTDEDFHVLAIPQIGPGKGDGDYGDDDFGRFRESGDPDDLYAFRTPTLLNVSVTFPYGHDGAYATLEDIVRHHLNPAAAVVDYDLANLDATIQTDHLAVNTTNALAKLEVDRLAGKSLLKNADLTEHQIQDLVSFLQALTDPCVEDADCLAPWSPGPADVDPDGLRLEAITHE